MQLKHIYIGFLGLIVLSSFAMIQDDNIILDLKLLTTQTEFESGSSITLKFSTSKMSDLILYCSSSYGTTLLSPKVEKSTITYTIPDHISNKSGQVQWQLINGNNSLFGQFNIIPKSDVATMETYIGPPSIEAGGTDYTMLVVIPTDRLDNPLPKNTLVNAKHQFLSSQFSDSITTNHIIAYTTIYSKNESGRMLVSSESLNTNSKEYSITVFPAIPTHFKISAKQPHNYADGNQVTTFETSVIRDKLNNIVSDGTYVSFFITNSKGNKLKTSGTTINGIAKAMMIHPDHLTQWTVKGYVDGISESDPISVNFKQVIEDFDVTFSNNNRLISIGPLQSFMNQLIPDGFKVELLLYKNDKLLNILTKTSIDGYVNFNLTSNIATNDTYTIVIKSAGLEKTFNTINVW
ncbi:hypothetical protein [Psychroserpens algicola]|uniref:Uncharacterized protein n=1 Tax=Psychroserpens algicola TaxID=1719034 RepID=A0ABT0H4P6_9FLAO|nr:hypothetical protein [Psychroserpens algicola]MCK8479340.1 hypothetical protein [Psychroserpens algicola]